MNILVTGSTGIVGRYITKKLIDDKYKVTELPNSSQLDLSNSNQIDSFFLNKKFDVVIHLATKGGNRFITYPWSISDENILMYYNLFRNKHSFNKFISFGSGAEISMLDQPYGFSKSVIRKSILNNIGFYNLRIYNAFSNEELDTRFIKSSIIKYINNKPIKIYQDNYVDFMYIEDVYKILRVYLDSDDLDKEVDCVYKSKYKLSTIASIINNLDSHKVEILVEDDKAEKNYIGTGNTLQLDFIGLEEGIKRVYNDLKK